MAFDRKYGRVTLERGTIADDEPVFVVRAQDALAPALLEHYASMCEQAGSPERHVRGVVSAAEGFRVWQRTHRTQTPVSAPPG